MAWYGMECEGTSSMFFLRYHQFFLDDEGFRGNYNKLGRFPLRPAEVFVVSTLVLTNSSVLC